MGVSPPRGIAIRDSCHGTSGRLPAHPRAHRDGSPCHARRGGASPHRPPEPSAAALWPRAGGRSWRAATGRRACRPRLVGLLGTPDLAPDEALWIAPLRARPHRVPAGAAIGCAFVNAGGRVLRVVDPLPRWRAAGCRGARGVVECAAGVLEEAGVRPGDVLRLEPGENPARSGQPAPARGVIRHRPAPLPAITRAPSGAPQRRRGRRIWRWGLGGPFPRSSWWRTTRRRGVPRREPDRGPLRADLGDERGGGDGRPGRAPGPTRPSSTSACPA